ncbi:amidase family protein [Alicyclobacillus sp. ALC3]|uniref:amidase family protein n=1 Tax=Alicyclobacillus sp. ALC3 TaxID=2796143 RepID=UPI0023783318|nr:amidase family protein [Alicyclobacillus sp. ALC3]
MPTYDLESTFDLAKASIRELQLQMTTGQLTSVELVSVYLTRIAALDKTGPALNAVLEVNPDALQTAEALDAERRRQGPRGPLHGIPVLIKGNIDTGDKMHTTAGSRALANCYAKTDSLVVKRLRAAGAVILGKTNLTEWANFMAENMSNGYSSLGGQVRNPYGPGTHDTGGSSAGTGAAIAASLAAVGVGTETSGSILSPSSQNSLVGIKPTVGLISRTGIIPISFSQDTAGPMARTVEDAAVLLGAMTGVDPDDPATGSSLGVALTDYTVFLDETALKGARIGIPRDPFYTELPEAKQKVMDGVIAQLTELGATVVDVDLPKAALGEDINVLVYEFKSAINAYLGGVGTNVPVHSLAELIAYNEAHSAEMLRYGQAVLVKSEETSGSLTESAYIESRLRDLRVTREEGIDGLLTSHKLDALLFPNNWGAGVAAKAGYPSITVPAGYTPDGEPVGMTLTGTAFSEPTLIRLAYAYEQGTHHRVEPAL